MDDAGLLEFHETYFPYNTYRDEDLALYKGMGSRSVFALRTWNPWRIYRSFKTMSERLKKRKDLQGNMAGEGLIQGGILIFDKDGILRFAYEEQVGQELEMNDILAAMKTLSSKNDNNSSEQPIESSSASEL